MSTTPRHRRAARSVISTGKARSLAAKASVDPRTLDALLEGREVRGLAGERARQVLIEAGYLQTTERTQAA